MDFNITLGLGGWAVVIVAAVAYGIVLQLIGDAEFGYEWVATAIGGGIGAIVCSEFIIDLRTFSPVWDDLALVPALIGGLVVATIVGVVVRYGMGGSLLHHPSAA